MVSDALIGRVDNWVCDPRDNGFVAWLAGMKYTALPRRLNIVPVAEHQVVVVIPEVLKA